MVERVSLNLKTDLDLLVLLMALEVLRAEPRKGLDTY